MWILAFMSRGCASNQVANILVYLSTLAARDNKDTNKPHLPRNFICLELLLMWKVLLFNLKAAELLVTSLCMFHVHFPVVLYFASSVFFSSRTEHRGGFVERQQTVNVQPAAKENQLTGFPTPFTCSLQTCSFMLEVLPLLPSVLLDSLKDYRPKTSLQISACSFLFFNFPQILPCSRALRGEKIKKLYETYVRCS